MTAHNLPDVLHKHLFADPGVHVYAVLDGAAIPDLPRMLQIQQVESVCLYRGELEPELARMAPYQVPLEQGSPFTTWLLQEGWGRHWGIFALSPVDWRPMREHLRSLVIAYDPDYQPLYFRYYDPRVLRVYLPTCNAEELATIFGPVTRYLCEGEDGGLLKFWISAGQLGSERVALPPTTKP